jgi:integrase
MSERLSARACTIGLDLGTTTLKAIAFDDGAGQTVAYAAATIPLLATPDVDADTDSTVVYAEQDPDAVVEAATAVLAQAVTQARTSVEALLTAARESPHPCDFALVAMLGLLGLRIFEATGADIADLGEEHGHRVLHVCGKGTKIVLLPLPPAVGRAIDQAIGGRTRGPVLLNSRGARMDRHAATRRLRHLAGIAGVRITRPHPHMLRHTYVTTMLDAGVDLRDVQIAARHADPRTTMRYDRARKNLDRHPNYILAAYMASGT